jgi:hypothetical protein
MLEREVRDWRRHLRGVTGWFSTIGADRNADHASYG